MITRIAGIKLKDLASKFKAVAVTGPRQSGKTTMVKAVFKQKPYVSLENPDTRRFATEDPRGFLETYRHGAILDEVQRVPELFSYLQELLDTSSKKGLFILTGSNNFLLQENISQTLAGRVGYLYLLPLSIEEMHKAKILPDSDDELILQGFYPPVYDQNIPSQDWAPNYIKTYIERDVRQVKNISDLLIFERFVRVLAGRNGQELNSSAISVETGVDIKTVQSWIGILESSFIIYLLRQHHKNYNKTIIKRPKLYFYDSSLVCSLLGIRNKEHLHLHPLRGSLFEGMVVTELLKRRTNRGLPINIHFWRDKAGHEIDVIVDDGGKLLPIEIKSGSTFHESFLKNINYWNKLSGGKKGLVLYAGSQSQIRSNGIEVANWRGLAKEDW